jgi:Sulfotransferase domain
MPASNTIPNFAYIGTSKAGSTWLFNALAGHPEVYLASDKGLYYFDHHFDEGPQWYLDHFRAAGDRPAVGEISHSYLSSPQAPARIAEFNPRLRLLVCLREPVDRAFSDYLAMVKNGQVDGPFSDTLERFPRLLDRGRYATHLQRYLDLFPWEQVHVSLFDDLRADPQAYADDVFGFLGITHVRLPPADLKSRMPASQPRSAAVATAAKSASKLAKRTGLRRLRSRVKRSVLVRQALYRPYKDDRPTVDPALAAELRQGFTDEVLRLDTMLGRSVSEQWGYPTTRQHAEDGSHSVRGR